MESPTLSWRTAEVRDGTLTVEIDGDRPKGWKATFHQTVRLLGGGGWGEVSLKRGTVRVTEVAEGTEDELRHFLEGAIQQANATHVEPEDEAEDRADEPDEEQEEDGDGADTRMTSRFRDFGA